MTDVVLYKKSQNKLSHIFNKTYVAASRASKDVFQQVKAVAASTCSVMVFGESGTGKELIATYCHRNSLFKDGPFIAVNCAALPEDLLESELFGHKKGSFTGATKDHEGLIYRAHNGTLFLDEIGDMSLKTQAKLLRVLQEKKLRPVGGDTEFDVNFRVICATNKNLLDATKSGEFREDLYFRLSVVPIYIPPLRSRKDDIIPLANHFVNRCASLCHQPPKIISEEAKQRLLEHKWNGNVRELNNVIERAVVFAGNDNIDAEHIRFDTDFLMNHKEKGSTYSDANIPFNLKERERIAIKAALAKTKGVKSEAAKLLGIDRKTLFRKEKEYVINQ